MKKSTGNFMTDTVIELKRELKTLRSDSRPAPNFMSERVSTNTSRERMKKMDKGQIKRLLDTAGRDGVKQMLGIKRSAQ